MNNRYSKTNKLLNNSPIYKQLLNEKNLKNLVQYATFNFNNLKNINQYNFDSTTHIVEPFERLYMISQKYYGSPEYGWLIAYTNKISNELEIKSGDPLIIYLPLESVLELL